jgi:GAF domain-containing protein/tetratricopeptide (TPR) repeat protein
MAKKSLAVRKAIKTGKPKIARKQTVKTVVKLSNKRLNEMLSQARDLQWAGQHEKAIEVCTQALDAIGKGNSRTVQIQMDLLESRAESSFALLNEDAIQNDAKTMMRIANAAPSSPKGRKFALKAQALTLKGRLHGYQNNVELARKTLSNAYKFARKSKQVIVQAESLHWLSLQQPGELQRRGLEQTSDLFLSLGDQTRAVRALSGLAFANMRAGRIDEARQIVQTALKISVQAGTNRWRGETLNTLAIMEVDHAKSLTLLKQAHRAIEASGYLTRISATTNNLGFRYAQLGLYPRALRFYKKSFDILPPGYGIYPLSNIVHIEIQNGDLDRARNHIAQLRSMNLDKGIKAFTEELTGSIALAEGNPKVGIRYIRKAIRISQDAGLVHEIGETAFLGQAYLAEGNLKVALKATSSAVKKHRELNFPVIDDHPSQNIWWRHSLALRANKKNMEADEALEMAYELLLKGIESLRDDGLRRNYLNKVRINREILQAWDKYAAEHRLPKERRLAHLEVESSLREPFERLAEISLELNALHTLEEIQTFLVEEATELIGGERVMLILEKRSDDFSRPDKATEVATTLEVADSLLPRGEDASVVLKSISKHLTQARRTRTVQLILPKKARGGILSRVVAPLIAQNQVLGYLYTDMDSLYGAFDETDRDMLGMLANQGAVALDNAGLLEVLERKVEERTEELNSRVNELAIINSVQEGLASQLDIQGIYELVGDKLYEIFKPDILNIAIYHPETNRTTYPYAIGLGEKRDLPEVELRGFTGEAIRKRKTIVVNKDIEDRSREVGSYNLVKEGPDPQSMVYVPIIAGDDVLGVVSLQSFEHGYIFPESDVRLMETLTSSMSVALQNAQSFKAEQERVAELQIINSIQQGLAAELDFQAIIDLVGDKLREVFNTKDFGIRWYDEKTDLVHFMYEYEHGNRLTIPSRSLAQAASIRLLKETRLPVVANTVELAARTGGAPLPGTDMSKSIIIVPIISSDRLIGSLQMEDYERENAYGESELRLLTTIAASLGTALENARLFDETQQRNAELAIINAVQGALAAELDIQAIYEAVGEKIREIFDANTILLITFDHDKGMMNRHYAYEKGKRYQIEPTSIPPAWAYFIQRGETMLINDGVEYLKQVDPEFTPPAGEVPKSFIVVPLMTKGKLTGAISIQNVDRENAFGDSDARLLETLANAMSVALENARLFDEVQKKNAEITENLEQQTATSDILRVIAESPTDVQPVFDTIIERATKLCGAVAGYAYRVIGEKIHLVSEYNGIPEATQLIRSVFPLPLDKPEKESTVAPVIRNRSILHVTDQKTDPRLDPATRELSIRYEVGSSLYIPLVKNDNGIGAFGIFRRETEPFSEKQIALVQTFANQAVIAIENVRLFNELQQRNAEISESLERETASNDILRVIAESPTNIQPVLDVIVRNAAQLSGSEDAIIGIGKQQ